MKKRVLSLLLALGMGVSLLPMGALAAEETEPPRGTLSYSVVIEPQYEDAQSFSEGLAAVKKDGKWGYIDEAGTVVIPFQYDRAYQFNEGYAVVGKLVDTQENTSWDDETMNYVNDGTYTYIYEMGFIDKEGQITWFMGKGYDEEVMEYVPMTYRLYFDSESGYNSYDLLFYNGYIFFADMEEAGYAPFDTTGADASDVIPKIGEDWTDLYGWQITEGMAIYGVLYSYAESQYYRDIATGEKIEVLFEDRDYGMSWVELRPFNQGLAPACSVWEIYNPETDDLETFRWWGFVDKKGQWVIDPGYTNFIVNGLTTEYQVFGETGLAMMSDTNDKWGAIDKTGKIVVPFEYDWLWPYAFGLAAFQKDGKWGYLDEKGQVVLPAAYENTSGFSGNGYAVVYDGSKAFLIDSEGTPIPGADSLDPDTYFSTAEDGSPRCLTPSEYVVIQENGKYGYGHIEYKPALPQAEEMDSWAYEEVTAAIEEDLVPTHLQCLYLNDITRDEFCDLIMQAITEVLDVEMEDLVLEKTGKSLDTWQHAYPFKDSTSSTVIAANALGIINGRGDRIFDPYTSITRQEAAALLMRGAGVLGMDTSSAADAGFADGSQVGVWFTDAVNFVCQINVMKGTGNNSFTPTGTYTREQSYMTIYRLFQAVVGQ